MNFRDVLEQGAICDLKTVEEALLNFEIHAIQLLAYDEIPETTKRIREEYAQYLRDGGGPDIPADIVAAAEKELQAYHEGAT